MVKPVTVKFPIFCIVTTRGICVSPGAASISELTVPHDAFTTRSIGACIGKYGACDKTLLKIRKIRAAAKAIFLKGIEGKKITFYLNKQVASVGQVSFSEPIGESPLGPIKVIIENDDPYKIIDWLTSE